MKHIQFREESRYPGYYYRADFKAINDDEWKCFVNSKYDHKTDTWEVKKVKWQPLISVGENEPEGMKHMGPDL
jgi:adenylylsulfate reductase subunit A